MIEAEDAKPFLNHLVGVVHTDSGKDYFLKGTLVNLTNTSLTIENERFGKCLVSLDSIKKVKELNQHV